MLKLWIVVHIYLVLTQIYKLWLLFLACRHRTQKVPEYKGELPRYTVIVPLYKEAEVAERLVGRLNLLDYPTDKLEILLAIEPNDKETLEAFAKIDLPKHYQIVMVPPGKYKTKPHACNCALEYATGQLLTIYDAEDAPEPDQLKKAVNVFAASPKKVVCLQAKLNIYNRDENGLTRFFALEYGAWFNYYIKGTTSAHVATPLGGTSNHFKVDALKALGGWKASSVTEDVELGMKIADAGLEVGHLDSFTWEEAPVELMQWIRQRTRWQMGYLLTWFFYSFKRSMKLKTLTTLHLFVLGNPLNSMLYLPLGSVFVAYLLGHNFLDIPPFWNAVGWTLMIVGNLSVMSVHFLAGRKMGFKFAPLALFLPLYWMLHCVASYRAVYKILTGKASVWEKTPHGVSKTGDER